MHAPRGKGKEGKKERLKSILSSLGKRKGEKGRRRALSINVSCFFCSSSHTHGGERFGKRKGGERGERGFFLLPLLCGRRLERRLPPSLNGMRGDYWPLAAVVVIMKKYDMLRNDKKWASFRNCNMIFYCISSESGKTKTLKCQKTISHFVPRKKRFCRLFFVLLPPMTGHFRAPEWNHN